MPTPLLTVAETQDALSVSRQTLYNWEAEGLLVPVRLGKLVRFRADDIENVAQHGLVRNK